MQNGSLIKANRRNGQEVWEFRWRDRTSGKAVYRRIVLGSAQQFPTEIEARAAVAGIVLEINGFSGFGLRDYTPTCPRRASFLSLYFHTAQSFPITCTFQSA